VITTLKELSYIKLMKVKWLSYCFYYFIQNQTKCGCFVGANRFFLTRFL